MKFFEKKILYVTLMLQVDRHGKKKFKADKAEGNH